VNYDYELSVRVLACEGTSDGGVSFRAVWELGTGGGATPTKHGAYRAADFKWDGKNEATLAEKLSEAVAGLAADIAGALAKR